MLVSLDVKKAFSIIQILVYDKTLGKLEIIGNQKSHRLVNSFPRSMLRGLVCMQRRRYGVSMRVVTLDVSFPSLNCTVVTKSTGTQSDSLGTESAAHLFTIGGSAGSLEKSFGVFSYGQLSILGI